MQKVPIRSCKFLGNFLCAEVTNEWATERPKTKMPVLVAQDNVLPLANIRDAGVLIHYDVPELSKYNFGFRFSCLADRMRSFNDKASSLVMSTGVNIFDAAVFFMKMLTGLFMCMSINYMMHLWGRCWVL